LKGVRILKEKLKKKENEWYRVIFEEIESTPKEVKEKKFKGQESEVHKKLELQQQYKGKNKDFIWVTLWDLPLEYSKQEVRRLLKKFGEAEEIRMKKLTYYQVAEIKLFTSNREQEEKIRANWVIGLENGKLARLTIGNQNLEDLKKREGFRAILTNVPSTAHETLLLRALQAAGAKAVYIPYNSNRNPSHIAKVFFKSKEDMEKALNRNIYYFNTKLYWKGNYRYNKREYESKPSYEYKRRELEYKNIEGGRKREETKTEIREEKEETNRYKRNSEHGERKGESSYKNILYKYN
jgi:hypothetical protein